MQDEFGSPACNQVVRAIFVEAFVLVTEALTAIARGQKCDERWDSKANRGICEAQAWNAMQTLLQQLG